MIRQTVSVVVSTSMLLVVMSGCKLYRANNADQSNEMERLRAENARLRAENRGPRQPQGPTSVSPEGTRNLKERGILVSRDGDKIKMTLPNIILFSSGSASLRSDSKKAIDAASKVIKQEFPGAELVIQGHTDNQPIKHSADKFKSNYDLSVARANAVASALKKQGLKNRIVVEGLGETKPLNDNKTAEDRAKNRRVEILIGSGNGGVDRAPVVDDAETGF